MLTHINPLAPVEMFKQGRADGTTRRVGNVLADGGSYGDAAKQAFAGGQIGMGQNLQAQGFGQQMDRRQLQMKLQQAAQKADAAEVGRQMQVFDTIGQVANGLMTVPVDQRGAALQAQLPRLSALGATPEQLRPYFEAITDPETSDGVLSSLRSLAVDADEIFKAQKNQVLNQGDQMVGYQGGQVRTLAENEDMEKREANRIALINARKPRAAAVQVNTGASGPRVGSIPQGYQLVQDPQSGGYRMEPIPGGPADVSGKVAATNEATGNRASVVMANIDRAIEQAQQSMTTGAVGAVARQVPGTPAFDLRATIDGIVSNIGFSELQSMRENSPTGGALGQVSNIELNMLQSVLGSLNSAQSEEQLVRNLQVVRRQYARTIKALQDEYAAAGQSLPFSVPDDLRADEQVGDRSDDPLGLR